MSTGKTRGLRGSILEDMINQTNEVYLEKGLALVQKIPTPITPITMDQKTKHITLAYFDQKSTVDYIGAVQGIPVCFDAKECAQDTFSLQNIHEHQFQFMTDFEKQGGVAFVLILFTDRNDMYYMRYQELKSYIDRVAEGHAKNFKYNELDDDYFIHAKGPALVHYLEGLNLDLSSRPENDE